MGSLKSEPDSPKAANGALSYFPLPMREGLRVRYSDA
jgi:hypothetical protein